MLGPLDAPEPTLSWLQLISASLALPSTAALFAGIWKAWTWYFDRSDTGRKTADEQRLLEDQQFREAMQTGTVRIDARTDRLFQMQDDIIAKQSIAQTKLEADRDRGWNLALFHSRGWWTLGRLYDDLRHDYLNLLTWIEMAVKRHPDILVRPDSLLDKPIPPKADVPETIDDMTEG